MSFIDAFARMVNLFISQRDLSESSTTSYLRTVFYTPDVNNVFHVPYLLLTINSFTLSL